MREYEEYMLKYGSESLSPTLRNHGFVGDETTYLERVKGCFILRGWQYMLNNTCLIHGLTWFNHVSEIIMKKRYQTALGPLLRIFFMRILYDIITVLYIYTYTHIYNQFNMIVGITKTLCLERMEQ